MGFSEHGGADESRLGLRRAHRVGFFFSNAERARSCPLHTALATLQVPVAYPISVVTPPCLPGTYIVPGDITIAPQHSWPSSPLAPYEIDNLEHTSIGPTGSATLISGDLYTGSAPNTEQQVSLSGASTTSDSKKELKKFHCLIPGCRRAYVNKRDLTRHSKKHTRPFTFDCPAAGCSKTGDHANYLCYKFIEHLRKGHRKPTMWICPVTSCDAQAKDLGLLVEHIRGHDSDVQGDKVVSAICEASKNQEK